MRERSKVCATQFAFAAPASITRRDLSGYCGTRTPRNFIRCRPSASIVSPVALLLVSIRSQTPHDLASCPAPNEKVPTTAAAGRPCDCTAELPTWVIRDRMKPSISSPL